MNEQRVQWVEDRDWEYRCDFEVVAEQLRHDAAELVFEGLDTFADVYLNGELILRSDNMFVGHRIGVKEQLRIGHNELHIVFHSPITHLMPLRTATGFDYPADNDHRAEKLSIYARKAPYSFGWDWGIRMVTMGVWRPIGLEFRDRARVNDFWVRQTELNDKEARLTCSVEVAPLSAFAQSLTAQVRCTLRGREVASFREEFSLQDEAKTLTMPISIADPKRWMPRGWGDPTLYDVEVTLRDGKEVIDCRKTRIGLRTLRLVTDADEYGESFYFEVNGLPLFAKGANYIPQDALLTEVAEERYHRLFEDITAANMNMIRVWGGGTYESDLFYDLADENGILVWQDFMFACTTYPASDEFLNQVSAEAEYNLKRLRNHPSVALWCGNNEIAEGLNYWGWNYKYSEDVFSGMKRGYDRLFCSLLPSKVAEFDPDRRYIHTSPMVANWGRPATWGTGDSHNWGVWYGQKPFESLDADLPRFMSEFGFQAFPEMKTIAAFAPREEWALESEVMTAHQKSSIGNALIRKYMERDYRVPERFEDFVYVGLVMQGEGMRRGFEAHRRNRPYCMGSLYWQLNDSWPVVSWSSVDYFGNRKALHYEAERAFADLALSIYEEEGKLQVWGLSDRLKREEALSLRLTLMDFEGRVLKTDAVDFALEGNTSAVVFEDDLSAWTTDPAHTVLKVKLGKGRTILATDTHYFARTKDLDLPEAVIVLSQKVRDGFCEVAVESPVLVKNLFVECSVQGARFTDNFFDLLPHERRTIRIASPEIHRGDDIPLTLHHIRATYK